jgi:hypothetical protein
MVLCTAMPTIPSFMQTVQHKPAFFASLYTQPMEAVAIRALIRTRLALPGAPQILLQLGVARTAQATARRPPDELTEPR